MASDNRAAVRLLTVLDARSFLDEWESADVLPSAAKKDVRAHLRDKKSCEVLAEDVESADVIVLTNADSADADELEMLEAMVRELNPSATIVRRTGDGEGRLHKLLKRGRLEGVIRSRGLIWVATHFGDAITWSQVGNSMDLSPGEPWLHAKLPVAEWPDGAPRWARTAAHGDRRVELGLVGMDADVKAVRRLLTKALVTKEEFALGVEAWQEWEDKVSPRVAQQLKSIPKPQLSDAHADEAPRDIDTALLVLMPPPPASSENMATDKIVVVHKPTGLSKIQDDKVQLAVWRRAEVPKFIAALSDPAIAPSGLPRFDGLVASDGASEAVRARLRAQEKLALTDGDVEELVGDIGRLVKVFAKLTKTSDVLVRLECLSDNGCQFWHQDSVSFRLLTTYRGPCTEWVHPDVSKATLKKRSADSQDKQHLCHHDVALFKGRGETYHGDGLLNHPGIVHRSPHIAGSGVYRVVLVLDIPQTISRGG